MLVQTARGDAERLLVPGSRVMVVRAPAISRTSSGPIIDALERLGLVERRSDAADRRRHAVTLTADGQGMTGRLRQAGAELENRFLAILSSQERDALHAILTKLVTSVMRAARSP